MAIVFSSKEDWEKEKALSEFSLLPQDDYKLEVAEINEEQQTKYMSTELEDVVKVKLKILSFKDGGQAVDENGDDATDRLAFFTITPKSAGWRMDGTPSKTRAFVTQAMGVDVNEEVKLDKWEDLLGKIVYAEIIQYERKNGGKGNKISRIVAPPRD